MLSFFILLVLIYVDFKATTMNIIPAQPIPLFYWKDDLDGFLAAVSAKLILAKNPTELLGLSSGDTIEGLRQRYPIFFGVKFDRLGAMPVMSGAANCQILSRTNQAASLISQYDAAKNHDPFLKRVPLRWRLTFDDHSSLVRMAWMNFTTADRMNEIAPDFIKYAMAAIEHPAAIPTNDDFLRGVAKDHSFLTGNFDAFKMRFITPFKTRGKDIVTSMVDLGKRPVDKDHLTYNLIERSAITTDFLGSQVKILNAPAELADQAGRIMAENQPFAVVYEDIMKDNKRVYRLYSTQDGLDVTKVAEKYNPVGDNRHVTFTAKINFNNHKFI